jgi:hypothetical protein
MIAKPLLQEECLVLITLYDEHFTCFEINQGDTLPIEEDDHGIVVHVKVVIGLHEVANIYLREVSIILIPLSIQVIFSLVIDHLLLDSILIHVKFIDLVA